jgi:hypothetical protein
MRNNVLAASLIAIRDQLAGRAWEPWITLPSRELGRSKGALSMDDPDKQKLGRKPASSEQDYEVQSFAEKYDLEVAEAAAIIKRVGQSRRRLDSYMAQRGT